jgi:hypothetical protein
MNGISPGENCVITHDIGTAFRQDEKVVVEAVEPDAGRPEFKYVVYSRTDQKKYRLSDQDLRAQPPAMPPEVQVTQTVAGIPPSAGSSTGKTIGIVIIALLVVAALVLGILYLTTWKDSGDQPAVELPTTPATTTPAPKPEPESKYGTVKVTQEAYDQARDGMSYSQVRGIFGGQGVKQSETGSPGEPGYTITYSWDGEEPGSSVTCTFEDDKLTRKSNKGL